MSGSRPSTDEYFLRHAVLVSSRGTCRRRKAGCVLTNRYHHVLATGYNGTPSGMSHCIDDPCPGVDMPSGSGLLDCAALHAEWNALLQCRDVQEIVTAYVTASPCVICMRMLCNTSVKRIVFIDEYPHPESRWLAVIKGIDWIHFGQLP